MKIIYSIIPVVVISIILFSISSFQIKDDTLLKKEKSLESFKQMLTVIKHPRCMNCHPSDDYPRQGDGRNVHLFNVQRGKDNEGLAAMRCNTCHQKTNNPYSNVPGAPKWHLAPIGMAWQGLSDEQIGESILNQKTNGGKNLEELVHHMTKDTLVLWAWNPGKGRALPPLNQAQFAKAVKDWADNGAVVK